MCALWQDLQFALRILRKNPGFTAVAMLTLALGIGANTAIFSVLNAVLLQPLPFTDSSRLISITQSDRETGTAGIITSWTKYSAFREQSKTLAGIAAYYQLNSSLVTDRGPELLNTARASSEFFGVLGVVPALGRTFTPEEDVPTGSDVAVLSNAFWHSHFAADPHTIGRAISLDGDSVVVVGVLPATFHFAPVYPEPDLWLPRASQTSLLTPQQLHTGGGYLSLVGRLKDGETLARAQAELETINARYRQQFTSFADASKFVPVAVTLQDNLLGTLRPSLLVLLAAVGFVLLIASANVANLLLARATAREREIGIRKALGASRGRLVRQLLSESLVLSLCGGFLGVWLAAALLPALRNVSPGAVPRLPDARIGGLVLLFTLLLCVLTGLIFGLVPSWQAAGRELQDTLREGSRGSSPGGRRGKFRAVLVAAEIGLALVLMTGAGLLIQSFAHLMRVNPGFSVSHLMTFPIALPPTRYPQPQQQEAFYRQLLERVRAIPEVDAAGATSYLPLAGGARFVFICPEGRVCLGVGKDPIIAQRQVTTGYFDTVRAPLLLGRVFNEQDIAGGNPVAMVSETAAQDYWPKQNPIGKHIANPRDNIQREVIGVVADVKFLGLNTPGADELYLPITQVPYSVLTLLVRSTASSQSLVSAVREKIAETDPNLPVSGISSMADIVSTSVAQPRIIMQFVGVFAGIALLLAAIGIYGVMSYTVNARKQEMGIRLALGAEPVDLLGLVVGQGMRITFVGVAAGVAISLMLTRLLSSLLFGVRSTDPLAFAGAALLLVATALLACYLPARRATRVDPIVVLRYE